MTLDAAHGCVVDLDGVVWLSGTALPGAAEGVRRLRDHGVPLLFATNNAAPTVVELRERLLAIGIEAGEDELATSAQAAALLVPRGGRAYVVGEDGLREALAHAGVVVDETRPDAVVVGLARRFDYDVCDRASAHVRAGARLIATNTDPTLPTPEGLRPGAGAIVAAIATAGGTAPEVAGKPHAPMARLVAARFGARGARVGAVVGDRVSTDGAFADVLGVPFCLVASAVVEPVPDGTARGATLLEALERLEA